MELHPLLLRQIKKHLKLEGDLPAEMIPFLSAVSNSFQHYESDRGFLQHAMETSSNELTETNRKLLSETEMQKNNIESLKSSIRSISVQELQIDDDDLSSISDILKQEIVKRKEAERRNIQNEQKYRAIIENMELGMLETDENGVIVHVYDQFTKMTGFENKDLAGTDGSETLLGKRASEFVNSQISKRKNLEPSAYEIELNHKDGHTIWALVSAAPLTDETGEMVGTVGIHFDITQRKVMEVEIIHAREDAEKALKARELFLANISHEIRTPMNGIIGISSLLSETDLAMQQREYLDAIQLSAKHLLVVINDVLDLSKIKSGKFTIEAIEFNLSNLLWPLKKTMQETAKNKGVHFKLQLDHKLKPVLFSDPTRLNQILSNLCSNAVKFTSQGEVVLRIEHAGKVDDKEIISFKVTDTGVGIEQSKLDLIFEQFTQADDSVTREFGGTGLGLAIAKQIVELMGGVLQVKSEYGKGSEFQFSLAIAAFDSSKLQETKKQIRSKNLHALPILLVEDNEINQMLAKTLLEQWNASVDVAYNGLKAIDMVAENEYELILMDMQMPVMGGIEATQLLRSTHNVNIPIIALTANAMVEERKNCLDAGMNDYVSKPFDPEELYDKIVALKGRD